MSRPLPANNCTNSMSCPNGDCIGCRNGQVWCQDPRCAPYCPDCGIPSDFDSIVNMTIVIILFCLLAILFIVWFVYGPQLFETHSDHERANVLVPQSTTIVRTQQ